MVGGSATASGLLLLIIMHGTCRLLLPLLLTTPPPPQLLPLPLGRGRLEESGLVRVDPARVEQAVLALVDNAIKYGPEGQRITLKSSSREGELHVEVGDRGPGIPEMELPHVYERFYRLDGVDEPGSGLGLSIAQTIAEAHGGRIEAESQPGGGTRMSLILPLLPDESRNDSRYASFKTQS